MTKSPSIMEGQVLERWKLSFPPEQLEAYIICAHPAAMAYSRMEIWLQEQNFKPPIAMIDLIDCLWSNTIASCNLSYEIYRNGKVLPEFIPDNIYSLWKDLFDAETEKT